MSISWIIKMDKEKFDEEIWDLFMMETMHRTNGNPIQADRVKNIRVKLKEAIGQSVQVDGFWFCTICGYQNGNVLKICTHCLNRRR